MKLTPIQRAAVDEVGNHVLVVACPGSGKTRTIVARLLRAIERVRNTPRRVACITYTNAGANEIERRVNRLIAMEDAAYCDIGTIHSFCLKAVLRNNHHLLTGYEARILVAAPETDEYEQLAREALSATQNGRGRIQDFENIRRTISGGPLIPADANLTPECVQFFWKILADRGLVDFPSITYFTYLLLLRYPHLALSVSSRYQEILIDEMQDTDQLQVEVLQRLAVGNRSRFFLVGDHFQSIQGFSGAEPARMFDLANYLKAKQDFPLYDNWRSSSAIVSVAEALCPRDPPMRSVGENRTCLNNPTIISATTAVEAVVGGFLPLLERARIDVTECAILAPAWYLLFPIARELRRLHIPVSGPGSRPYRRTRMFAGLIENISAYLAAPRPELLRRVQFQIFQTIQQAEGVDCYAVWERPGRLATTRLVFSAQQLRETTPSAIEWLKAMAPVCIDVLRVHGFIGIDASTRIHDSAAAIIQDIRDNGDINPDDLTVEDLGNFANPDGSLRLLTLHAAKGREFDAVCIVELQEGQFPHPRGDVEEARRVLYVGLTRPRKSLVLCHRRGSRIARFLAEPQLSPLFDSTSL